MTTTHFADLSVSCRSVSVSVYLSVCLFVCLFFCLSGSLSLSLSLVCLSVWLSLSFSLSCLSVCLALSLFISLLFVCLSGSLSLSFSLSFIRACSISRTGCKTGPNDRNATYSLWCSLVVSAGLQSHGAKLVQRLPQPQRRPFSVTPDRNLHHQHCSHADEIACPGETTA